VRCGRSGHTAASCPRPGEACVRCGESGHLAEDCQTVAWCRWCLAGGHSANNCPMPRQQEGTEAVPAEPSPERQGVWCILCLSDGHTSPACRGWAASRIDEVEAAEVLADSEPPGHVCSICMGTGHDNLSCPRMWCGMCHSTGHNAGDCPARREYEAEVHAQEEATEAVCASCLVEGHDAESCPLALLQAPCAACLASGRDPSVCPGIRDPRGTALRSCCVCFVIGHDASTCLEDWCPACPGQGHLPEDCPRTEGGPPRAECRRCRDRGRGPAPATGTRGAVAVAPPGLPGCAGCRRSGRGPSDLCHTYGRRAFDCSRAPEPSAGSASQEGGRRPPGGASIYDDDPMAGGTIPCGICGFVGHRAVGCPMGRCPECGRRCTAAHAASACPGVRCTTCLVKDHGWMVCPDRVRWVEVMGETATLRESEPSLPAPMTVGTIRTGETLEDFGTPDVGRVEVADSSPALSGEAEDSL